jgi:hypothetical protein
MFGALEFSDKMAGYGIQPIVGCALAVDFGDQDAAAQCAGQAGRRGSCCWRRARRLPQPDAAEFARLPGNAGPSGAARQARMAEGRAEA